MNKDYAINICLIPDTSTYTVCKDLNALDTKSHYNENSQAFIPHVTIVMKYVSDEDVEKIISEIQALDIKKIGSDLLWYYAKDMPNSSVWTGIKWKKNPEFISLQNKICDITQKYNTVERTRDMYAVDEYFEENQIPLWTEEDFKNKHDIHVTLWKKDIENEVKNIDIPKRVIFEKIAVWHMWNYGSVREILYEKDLV